MNEYINDCNKIYSHILSIMKQDYKFLSNIGLQPEKIMFVKYIKKKLIKFLPDA